MEQPTFAPWAYKKPQAALFTREFSDPEQPDAPPLKLSLRSLQKNATGMTAALSEADLLARQYLVGDDGGEPDVFAAPDSQPVDLSERLIENICIVRKMQPADERKDFIWWAVYADRFPNAWTQITTWVLLLNTGRAPEQKPLKSARPVSGDRPAAPETERGNSSAAPAAAS